MQVKRCCRGIKRKQWEKDCRGERMQRERNYRWREILLWERGCKGREVVGGEENDERLQGVRECRRDRLQRERNGRVREDS